jgi:glycolate oxidase iron-sulfur subunit
MEDPTEGMSSRGRVALLNKFTKGELRASRKLDERIFSCMLCGACNTLCPLGINITDAIYDGRKRLRGFNNKRRLFSFAAKISLKKPTRFFRVLKIIEGVNEVFPFFKIQPFKAIDIRLPDSALKDGPSIFKAEKPKGRIAVFAGCTVNLIYTHIGISLIESLNAMDYDVILPKGEVCCGAPLMGIGMQEDTAEVAYKNLALFKNFNVEAVIGLCPTCVHFIKNEYKKIIGEGIDNAVEVTQFFSSEAMKLGNMEVVLNRILSSAPPYLRTSVPKVIYHDPCNSFYNLNVTAEPRQILKVLGYRLIDSEKGCCGFGGTFKLLYQKLSEGILEKRVEEYKKADMIVTSCPNCILQLKSKIKDKQIVHIIEVIWKSLKGDKRWKKADLKS